MLAAAPAFAHGGQAHPGRATWTFDPWIIAPLLLAGGAYGLGLVRLRLKRRSWSAVHRWRAASYAAGWLALAGALLSPLHGLGEHFFTFHMIEHEIIMAVAAPLLALARPVGVALWSLPRRARRALASLAGGRVARSLWRHLTTPRNATIIHAVALWIWHAPLLLETALNHPGLHRLQHLAFFGSAILFWWALLRRADPGAATGHVFVTMLHMSGLGALIALSPRLLYPVQTTEALRWGLTPLEDQQLAGLLMWVPAGTVYAAAALVFARTWITRSSQSWRQPHALPG